MDAIWLALQQSAFAAYARESLWLYPLANILHVTAVIAFFGLVATMDFRLLGVFDGTPARRVIGRLRPLAIILLIVIAAAGLVLFAAEAVALARNPVFQIKVAAIALALGNIGLNEWTLRRGKEDASLARVTAGVSLAAWLFVAAMGRAIAYV
jgi:hypothetical protein